MLGNAATLINSQGHAIPYRLNEAEKIAFFKRHATNVELSNYLYRGQPSYGVIIKEGATPSEMLVYRGHVIDVTFMPVSRAVQQAPYVSTDEGYVQNMVADFVKAFTGEHEGLNTLVMVGVVIAIAVTVSAVRRK